MVVPEIMNYAYLSIHVSHIFEPGRQIEQSKKGKEQDKRL